jgi:uncharacterized protein
MRDDRTSSALPIPALSPLPEVAPHFDGLRAHRLVLPRCTSCEALIWYPRAFCPFCASPSVSWEEVPARGTIHSYTVVHRGTGPFAGHTPYVVAYVDLDSGPRILTNVVESTEHLAIGTRVEAVFEVSSDDEPILRFRLSPE